MNYRNYFVDADGVAVRHPRRYSRTSPGPSKSIPGQALRPAELLKRHLSGTLPEIDLSSRYEFHFNDKGEQVAEPLPNELSEIYRLSAAIREEQYKLALEHRKKEAEKHKADIIAAYEKEVAAKKAALDTSGQTTPPKG